MFTYFTSNYMLDFDTEGLAPVDEIIVCCLINSFISFTYISSNNMLDFDTGDSPKGWRR